jgi:hypothetical protein
MRVFSLANSHFYQLFAEATAPLTVSGRAIR